MAEFRLINLLEQLFHKKLRSGFDLLARIVFLQNREDFVRRFQAEQIDQEKDVLLIRTLNTLRQRLHSQ